MCIKSHIGRAVKETIMSKACLFCFIGIFAQLPARKKRTEMLTFRKITTETLLLQNTNLKNV